MLFVMKDIVKNVSGFNNYLALIDILRRHGNMFFIDVVYACIFAQREIIGSKVIYTCIFESKVIEIYAS